MGEGAEDGGKSFEDEILRLVLASLAGKDVNAATQAAEESIERARKTLVDEEENINEMLGAMDGAAYRGPRSPDLPPQTRSMAARDFVLSALKALGAKLAEQASEQYGCDFEGRRETIRFDEDPNPNSRAVLYRPGSPAFDRLISRITQSGVHDVQDADNDPQRGARSIAAEWVQSFGGFLRTTKLAGVTRAYSGEALLQIRATTAHDSYERLISVRCAGEEHQTDDRNGLEPIPPVIDRPQDVGLSLDRISRSAMLDPGIAEFCRFYSERQAEEMLAAGEDARKRRKLEDDFMPRLQTTIAGLRGTVRRILVGQVTYTIDQAEYTSTLKLVPSTSQIIDAPALATCARTRKQVPVEALGECAVSGTKALRHLLVKSTESDRFALPEHTVVCTLSGQRALSSEVETSAVTGKLVLRRLLKISSLSGRRAEPEHVGRCGFTQADALRSELATSEISGKRYRADQASRSEISGKIGHASEFIACSLSGRTLLLSEAERCAVTGQAVFPGMLEECAVSKQRVVPQELASSSVSGRRARKRYLVDSSISGVQCLQEEAIRSDAGRFCTRMEAQPCSWTSRETHPDDLRNCELTGVAIHYSVATRQPPYRLAPLAEMLGGTRRASDNKPFWSELAQLASAASDGRCVIESVQASPDAKQLAVCAEQKRLLGLRTRYVGFVYSMASRAIIGRLAVGKRANLAWVEAA